MIISFSCKNIFIHNNLNLDFLIKSKKNGEFIKNNDFFKFKDLKIQKKIGLLGGNASGKSSTMETLFFYWYMQDFQLVWRDLVFGTIDECNKRFNLLKINDPLKPLYQSMNNEDVLILSNDFSVFNFDKLNDEQKNIFFSILKRNFDNFYALRSFNSNINEIELKLSFLYDNEIFYSIYKLNKEGYLEISFFDSKNNLIINKKIDFITNDLKEKKPIYFKDWKLDVYSIFFENNLFSFNPIPLNYFASIIKFINSVFDYININNKKNNFVKWMKIADDSIVDVVMDIKTKTFSFKTIFDWNVTIDSSSLGTKKWIYLYYYFFIISESSTNKHSKIFLFDEIENSFHYKLVDVIFSVFDSFDNFQLLFTTHNPYIFNSFFRHDGIYLTDYKNKKYELTRVDDLKLKKDIVISSQYLKEKIGIHPNEQSIVDFINEELN